MVLQQQVIHTVRPLLQEVMAGVEVMELLLHQEVEWLLLQIHLTWEVLHRHFQPGVEAHQLLHQHQHQVEIPLICFS